MTSELMAKWDKELGVCTKDAQILQIKNSLSEGMRVVVIKIHRHGENAPVNSLLRLIHIRIWALKL